MTDKIDPAILKELIELGDRLTEDRLREIVIAEIERNEMDSVAQSHAFQEADGDEKKARAYYTKHRVRRIEDMIAQESIRHEQEIAAAEEKEKERIEAKKRYFEKENSDPFGSVGKTVSKIVIYGFGATVILTVISGFISLLIEK